MNWRIADPLDDGRQHSASAERNRDPILAVLRRVLPAKGRVLELGSGTGQHVVHFAKALPGLRWQPTDVDPALRASIEAWVRLDGVANVDRPIALDIRSRPWPVTAADAIVCINVIHVSPWEVVPALFEGAAAILPPGGVLVTYGAYRRNGTHTAPSNERFDAQLRDHDPSWGIRDLEAIEAVARTRAFALEEDVAMPANNLTLVFRKC
jgi:cyclopropane fatty-acyl-phospholipid synthase-like methyltransferase